MLLLPILQLLSAYTNNFWKNCLPFKIRASLNPLKISCVASNVNAFYYRKWENCQYKRDIRGQTFSCKLVEGQWIRVQPFLSPEEPDTHCRWIWSQSASPSKDHWKQPPCVCYSLHSPQPLCSWTVPSVPALLLLKQISYGELTMNSLVKRIGRAGTGNLLKSWHLKGAYSLCLAGWRKIEFLSMCFSIIYTRVSKVLFGYSDTLMQ